MVKVLLADDDSEMRLIIRKVLLEMDDVEIAGEADNGKILLEMVKKLSPDIVFLDIDMPQKDGLTVAKEIFKYDSKIVMVFATAYPDYAHEAFDVYAYDYLVKPFKLERIKQTVKRIKQIKDSNAALKEKALAKSKLFISLNGIYKVVYTEKIIFITRESRKTIIYTEDEIIKCYESLQKFESQLPNNVFFRCHQGFIINTNMIREIESCKNKVFSVKFFSTDQTALMTAEKLKELKEKYGIL